MRLCVHSIRRVLQTPLLVVFALCSALRYVHCRKFPRLRHVIHVLVIFFLLKKASIWFYSHSKLDLCLLNSSRGDCAVIIPMCGGLGKRLDTRLLVRHSALFLCFTLTSGSQNFFSKQSKPSHASNQKHP